MLFPLAYRPGDFARMRWWLLTFAVALPACRTLEPGAQPGLPVVGKPLIVVADGAGDFRACSDVIRHTAAACGLNCEVVTYVWSHGYLRNLADQTDLEHIRHRGRHLAELVRYQRQRFPQAPITLVGHSAGSGVVLAAAEQLPPGYIERIVLLSPSLSDKYDLRPALASTSDGIDTYISPADWFWLGVIVRLLGTQDDPKAERASGRFGFTVDQQDPQYAKLRVHRWSPELKLLGNDGGHFGGYQADFLREKVFPLLHPSYRGQAAAVQPATATE